MGGFTPSLKPVCAEFMGCCVNKSQTVELQQMWTVADASTFARYHKTAWPFFRIYIINEIVVLGIIYILKYRIRGQ